MVAGFFKGNLNKVERIGLLAAALCLIAPEMISSIVGVVLGVVILVMNTGRTKKAAVA